MVLVHELTNAEKELHTKLIRNYFSQVHNNNDISVEYLSNGAEKGVYKVKLSKGEFLAAAAARQKARKLLDEYTILHKLYGAIPDYFPKPVAHYRDPSEEDLGDLLVMELLPHLDLTKFDKHSYEGSLGFHRELAYQLGVAFAKVHAKSGYFSTEPHDGNVLVRVEERNKLEVKFCDAIQFKQGTLEEAVDSVMGYRDFRPECFRFIIQFRKGLAQGLNEATGVAWGDAWKRFAFLRRYNDIFPSDDTLPDLKAQSV